MQTDERVMIKLCLLLVRELHMCHNKKVKQSRYRPGVA